MRKLKPILPKSVQEILQKMTENEKELVSSFIFDLQTQIKDELKPIERLPVSANEIMIEARKEGRTKAFIRVELEKDSKKSFGIYRTKNPEKISLLVLKNNFSRLELFTYKNSLDKFFLSLNGEWIGFENGEEGKIISRILNYCRNLDPKRKRIRKRARKN